MFRDVLAIVELAWVKGPSERPFHKPWRSGMAVNGIYRHLQYGHWPWRISSCQVLASTNIAHTHIIYTLRKHAHHPPYSYDYLSHSGRAPGTLKEIYGHIMKYQPIKRIARTTSCGMQFRWKRLNNWYNGDHHGLPARIFLSDSRLDNPNFSSGQAQPSHDPLPDVFQFIGLPHTYHCIVSDSDRTWAVLGLVAGSMGTVGTCMECLLKRNGNSS